MKKCAARSALKIQTWAINYRDADFADGCKALAARTSFFLDGRRPHIARNIKAFADDGRLVQIAFYKDQRPR
jgi:hypothetical protein